MRNRFDDEFSPLSLAAYRAGEMLRALIVRLRALLARQRPRDTSIAWEDGEDPRN